MNFNFTSKAPDKESVIPSSPEGVSAFGGVFTPSILTILGVIMYLPFAVGCYWLYCGHVFD